MPIGPRSSSFSSRKLSFNNNSSSQTTTTSSSYAGESTIVAAEEIRIRRKDLDFEEPLLLAVKEGGEWMGEWQNIGPFLRTKIRK
jgi:hypothetical protein